MLGSLRGLVIIMKFSIPELFRVLPCWPTAQKQDSVSDSGECIPTFVRSSETLPVASIVELSVLVFTKREQHHQCCLLRGGFPFLSCPQREGDSLAGGGFHQIFLARDIPSSASRLRCNHACFWTMLAIITVRPGMPRSRPFPRLSIKRALLSYILTGTLMSGNFNVVQNLGKRQSKHPRSTCGIRASFMLC